MTLHALYPSPRAVTGRLKLTKMVEEKGEHHGEVEKTTEVRERERALDLSPSVEVYCG